MLRNCQKKDENVQEYQKIDDINRSLRKNGKRSPKILWQNRQNLNKPDIEQKHPNAQNIWISYTTQFGIWQIILAILNAFSIIWFNAIQLMKIDDIHDIAHGQQNSPNIEPIFFQEVLKQGVNQKQNIENVDPVCKLCFLKVVFLRQNYI